MQSIEYKAILEGLLFASGHEGLSLKQIANVLELAQTDVKLIIEEMKFDYENTKRGIMIIESNNLYYLSTKPEHHTYYQRLIEAPQNNHLSQAALEVLSIIAYEQPITRVEIDNIRGVNSDRAVQTLVARSLIEEKGRKKTTGNPILFGTTTDFLTYFGLSHIDDLPELPENITEETVEEEVDLFFDE